MAGTRARGCLGWVIGIVLLVGALKILFIYSGIYNVAATYPDSAPVAWVLSTVTDNSVKRHARGIKVPPLDDPAMIEKGVSHYQRMCLYCHGAPGVKIGPIGKQLNPAPPEMTEIAAEWAPNELFWITKNGIRMTGMPAWGVTHSDKEIWAIVAFVDKMPKMTPEQYKAMVRKAPKEMH